MLGGKVNCIWAYVTPMLECTCCHMFTCDINLFLHVKIFFQNVHVISSIKKCVQFKWNCDFHMQKGKCHIFIRVFIWIPCCYPSTIGLRLSRIPKTIDKQETNLDNHSCERFIYGLSNKQHQQQNSFEGRVDVTWFQSYYFNNKSTEDNAVIFVLLPELHK